VTAVVVLAAGRARRFHGVAKALLRLPGLGGSGVDGDTLLARHIRLWLGGGASRIVVVVSRVHLAAFQKYAGGRVQLVVADGDDDTSGSAVSLRCGLRFLNGTAGAEEGVVVLDADTVYEPVLVRHVLSPPRVTALFTTPVHAGDDEEVRVYVRADGRPALLGKGLSPDVTAGLRLKGESLGVISLARDAARRAEAMLDWMVGSPPAWTAHTTAGHRSEHEDLWQYMFALDAMDVVALPTLVFAECDTPEDHAFVISLVPALNQADLRQQSVGSQREREIGIADAAHELADRRRRAGVPDAMRDLSGRGHAIEQQ
jgi:choline kinase